MQYICRWACTYEEKVALADACTHENGPRIMAVCTRIISLCDKNWSDNHVQQTVTKGWIDKANVPAWYASVENDRLIWAYHLTW